MHVKHPCQRKSRRWRDESATPAFATERNRRCPTATATASQPPRNSRPVTASTPISTLTRTTADTGQFQTVAGAAYRIEGTDNLAAGHWTILIERLEGTGERLKFLDPATTGLRQYFYRIIRLP